MNAHCMTKQLFCNHLQKTMSFIKSYCIIRILYTMLTLEGTNFAFFNIIKSTLKWTS